MKTMLKSLAAIRTWMVVFTIMVLSGATLASELYSNPLASNVATVTPGTYGEIVVPGNGFEATKFESTKATIGGRGSFASIVSIISNKADIRTHTVSGWFKAESLECDIYAALNDIESATWGPSQTGYKVHCTSEGKLKIGECHSETLAFYNSIEIPTELKANSWYYLTIAIVHNASVNARNASAKVFVNGDLVYDDASKTFAVNVNGTFCDRFCVGAGVSAAGLYIDSTALTDAETIKGLATTPALVEAAPAIELKAMPANYTQPNMLIVPCGAYANTGLDPKDVTSMVTTFDVNGSDECWSGAMDESGAYPFAKDQEGSAAFADDKGMLHFRRGKIYAGDTLVRYFVPCRKDDGLVGFWDLVEGKFYGNEGTGHFISSYDGDVRLSYIQSSIHPNCRQYIDTGVLGNMGLESELDMLFPTAPSGETMPLAARRTSSSTDRFYLLYANGANIGYRLQDAAAELPFTVAVNTRYQFKTVMHNDELSFAVNGEVKKSVTSGFATANTDRNLFLFACNAGGSPNWYSSSRLYRAKISKVGTPLRNFVPARNADGVIGVIDLANGNKFYPNSGTGNGNGNNVFAWGGIAYNIDGTTLKLHEGTLAAEDLEGYTAVEKVDIRYELNAGAVTEYAIPLTLSEGVFALTDGEVKTVSVANKLTINGGVTLKIDAANGECDNFEVQSLDLTDATEDNPIIIEITNAVGMDWSAGATLITNTGLDDGPCANIRIADNDELVPVIKNGNLMIQMKSAAAHWTGAVDNDPSNPNNWEEGKVPDAETIVYFAGGSVPNILVGKTFAAKSIELDVTLAGDYDWRGLDPAIPVAGKIDLNGHSLTVADLTGDYEITDSRAEVYEQLEYIQSSGSQYILTGVDASTTLEAYGKFRIATYVNGAAIFGSGTYADKAYLFVMQDNTFKYYGNANNNAVWPTTWTAATVPTDDFEFSMANGTFTMTDGAAINQTAVNTDIGNIPANNKQVSLFACNYSAKHQSSIRAYSFKLVENGVVLRDFVPVRRSDGAIGLLDLAHLGTENEFYANNGSGTFTAGPTTGYIYTRQGSSELSMLGELHVDVASGKTIENATVTLSGTLKFVKEGDGTFAVTKAETYTGGTDVKGGTLRCDGNDIYPGALSTPVTVYKGAIYDIGNIVTEWHTLTTLAGGTLANKLKDHTYNGQLDYYAQNPGINVIDDSTISADFTFGMTASGYKVTTLDLGGNELTLSIASGKTFLLCNTDVSAGTLKTIGEGTFMISRTSCRAAETDFDLASKVSVGVATEVHDLTVRSGAEVSGNGVISVNGVYRPLGATAPKVALKDGASFDLSTLDTAFDLAVTTTTYADNATILIDVGERELKTDEKVIAWSAKPANVGGLTFQFVGTKLDSDVVNAVVADDGIHYPDVKTIVKATWTGAAGDGNVANPANWSCENALGGKVTGDDALPGARTVVQLDGEIAFNVTSGAPFTAGSVNANASLKSDCDWRGLNPSIPVSGNLNLNGHNLTISELSGNCEITDSSAEVYEQLEYIQSSGSQWIDTGVLGNMGLEAEVDMMFPTLPGSTVTTIPLAARGTGGNDRYYLLYTYGSTIGYRHYTMNYTEMPFTMTANTRYLFKSVLHNDELSFAVDGDIKKSKTEGITPINTGKNLYMFACNENGSVNYKASIRVYGAKISEGGKILRDFVPAKRVSDGAIGLLDLANLGTENEFYENKGSGVFTAGETTGRISTAGELHVDVEGGKTVEGYTLQLKGAIKLVKEGDGTFVVKYAQSYSGGTDVKGGTLKCGDNIYPGALPADTVPTEPLMVYEGAVFDVGLLHKWNAGIVLAGGTFANRHANFSYGQYAQNSAMKVVADSAIDAQYSFGIMNLGYGVSSLNLGGKELAISIAKSRSFWICNTDITAGAIKTTGEGTLLIQDGAVRAPEADFDLGCSAVTVKSAMEVKDLTVRSGTTVSGTSVITVNGVYSPLGAKAPYVAMNDGATLNLTGNNETFDLTGTTFADGATINIVPGNKRVGKVVSWTEATKPADTVKFVTDRQYGRLEVKADGIYLHFGLLFTIQ